MRFYPAIRWLLAILAIFTAAGCAGHGGSHGITLNYIEYNRGKSFPTRSDIQLDWQGNSLHFEQVRFEDDSFFPDDSIIPNAFIKPLLKLRLSDALKAFTEPYYGYRFIHFLRKNPHIGFGIEFTHHKLFLNQPGQRVRITGTYQGKPLDQALPVNSFIDYLSVSHGVNNLNLTITYRWLLKPAPAIPEGRWQPYVSAGFGMAFPHLELKLAGDGSQWSEYAYQAGSGNFGFAAGAGIRYKFTPHFGAYLEYKLSFSHLHDMHFLNGDGDLAMAFTTHHLMWGISFIF